MGSDKKKTEAWIVTPSNITEKKRGHAYSITGRALQLHILQFGWRRTRPIHVKRDKQLAKFWLTPISLATNQGFKEHELNYIARLVVQHQQTLLEAWHDYFGA